MPRAQIRSQLRKARQALTEQQQLDASKKVSAHLLSLPEVQSAKTIAAYIANKGELNLMPFIQQLWALKKQVVVPVICAQQNGKMWFVPYRPDTPLAANKYGIDEPRYTPNQVVPITDIQVVCTPLVGFDSHGQRIGMGGGFYDRLLAPWFKGELAHLTPVGVAHDCQHIAHLPSEAWDVPLPLVITPSKLWQFSPPTV